MALAAATNPDLASAEQAWSDGSYEQVLPLVSRALDSGLLSPEERLRAWELTAVTHAAFDHADPAVDAFQHVLGIDGAWRPGPEVSPKIRDLFERAHALGPLPRPEWHPAPEIAAPQPRTVEPDPEVPVFKRWWFWAGVGVVAGAAGGTAWWATRPDIPAGNLGTGALSR